MSYDIIRAAPSLVIGSLLLAVRLGRKRCGGCASNGGSGGHTKAGGSLTQAAPPPVSPAGAAAAITRPAASASVSPLLLCLTGEAEAVIRVYTLPHVGCLRRRLACVRWWCAFDDDALPQAHTSTYIWRKLRGQRTLTYAVPSSPHLQSSSSSFDRNPWVGS